MTWLMSLIFIKGIKNWLETIWIMLVTCHINDFINLSFVNLQIEFLMLNTAAIDGMLQFSELTYMGDIRWSEWIYL